jgi:hypothetical protein
MKRERSDTVENAVKAMFNASLPVPAVPVHLSVTESAMRFWPGISRARAREEWHEVDLAVAAQLALPGRHRARVGAAGR